MNETEMWVIGILSAAVGAVITGGVILAFSLSNRITRLESQLEFWLDSVGRAAAKAFHRDDDRFQIDKYLDKYRSGHEDMCYKDWADFKGYLQKILVNDVATKQEQAFAEFFIDICNHKMAPYTEAVVNHIAERNSPKYQELN